jgi:diguanylate cyclase (GGDEF)-like protein
MAQGFPGDIQQGEVNGEGESALLFRVRSLEQKARQEMKSLQLGLILAVGLVLLGLEVFYYLQGVPLWQDALDWLAGMAIALFFILLAFHRMGTGQRALLTALRSAVAISGYSPEEVDWQKLLGELNSAVGARSLALYLESPESQVIRLTAWAEAGSAPSLPPELRSDRWQSDLSPVIAAAPGLRVVPCSTAEGMVSGALLAFPRRQHIGSQGMALLELVASLCAAAVARGKLKRELVRLSVTDSLTRLYNRHFFTEVLEQEVKRSRRTGSPLSLILLDMDNLKQINDRYGHLVGDEALLLMAKSLRSSLRETDTAARLGGDEFGVILPDTDEEGARVVADRLMEKLQAGALRDSAGEPVDIQASYGIASLHPQDLSATDLIQRVDALLYQAKSSRAPDNHSWEKP